MPNPILLTSFDIWEAHHRSNSSDDLLHEVLTHQWLDDSVSYLRKVPVDFQQSPTQVLSAIKQRQPSAVICCGMAETRTWLTVESNGTVDSERLETAIDLPALVKDLTMTKISHDAGRFVCNHLYYSVLKFAQQADFLKHSLFVHVPLLNATNQQAIVQDFAKIVQRIQQLNS